LNGNARAAVTGPGSFKPLPNVGNPADSTNLVRILFIRTNLVLFFRRMNHRDPHPRQTRSCTAANAPAWGTLAQFLLSVCR